MEQAAVHGHAALGQAAGLARVRQGRVRQGLNAACTAAHAQNLFYTFTRGAVGSTLHSEDITDLGVPGLNATHYDIAPQFDWEYNKALNKIRLYRTDAGGKMALGKFEFKTSGVKLGFALGLNHITAQQLKDFNLPADVRTSSEVSVHYRELGSATEYNGFTVRTLADGNHGHALMSANAVNMFANDSVYLRINNLPPNAYESLYGGSTTVMAVIPMATSSNAEAFHHPDNPTSANIGKLLLTELDVSLTDAMGQLVDFNGVEHSFQLPVEAYEAGTAKDRPSQPMHRELNDYTRFGNIHDSSRRHAAHRQKR